MGTARAQNSAAGPVEAGWTFPRAKRTEETPPYSAAVLAPVP